MDKRDSWQPTGACGRCPWSPWHEGVKGWQSAKDGLPSQQSEGDEGRLLVRRMRHWGGGEETRTPHTDTHASGRGCHSRYDFPERLFDSS